MGVQQFSFQIDNKVEKIVTIEKVGRAVDVHVRFATDVVVEERSDRLDAAGDITVQSDQFGLILSYPRRGLARLLGQGKRRY